MQIVQYWDAGEPPRYVADLLATFRDRNPTLPHRLYDERSAAELIAARFGEREEAAFRACAVPAMRADYFRYCAVLALGGIYSDVGFRCTDSLSPLLADGRGGVLFRRDPPGYLLNGLFAFAAPGHPLLRLALDVATANIERRAAEMVQMVTGPWVFSSLWLLQRLCAFGGGGEDRDEGWKGGAGGGIERLAEPFRREVEAMIPTAAARREISPMLAPLFETVSDESRLAEAFGGVRIEPFESVAGCVREADGPLPYKGTDTYWIEWQKRGRTIFR